MSDDEMDDYVGRLDRGLSAISADTFIDQIVRWEVEASVEDRPVARGTMSARIGAILHSHPAAKI